MKRIASERAYRTGVPARPGGIRTASNTASITVESLKTAAGPRTCQLDRESSATLIERGAARSTAVGAAHAGPRPDPLLGQTDVKPKACHRAFRQLPGPDSLSRRRRARCLPSIAHAVNLRALDR